MYCAYQGYFHKDAKFGCDGMAKSLIVFGLNTTKLTPRWWHAVKAGARQGSIAMASGCTLATTSTTLLKTSRNSGPVHGSITRRRSFQPSRLLWPSPPMTSGRSQAGFILIPPKAWNNISRPGGHVRRASSVAASTADRMGSKEAKWTSGFSLAWSRASPTARKTLAWPCSALVSRRTLFRLPVPAVWWLWDATVGADDSKEVMMVAG